jgi:hypothetical protein
MATAIPVISAPKSDPSHNMSSWCDDGSLPEWTKAFRSGQGKTVNGSLHWL